MALDLEGTGDVKELVRRLRERRNTTMFIQGLLDIGPDKDCADAANMIEAMNSRSARQTDALRRISEQKTVAEMEAENGVGSADNVDFQTAYDTMIGMAREARE